MTNRCRVSPDRTRHCAWRASSWCVLGALLLTGAGGSAHALQRTAIGQIASLYGGRSVVLKADLRAPTATAEGMQAPMFDAKGWHFAAGSPVLRSGTLAEITGVFNYSERGFFLEVATADGSHGEALIDRPRVRVRVNIATPATDPSGQVAEAARLIEAIVAPVASAAP